MKIEAPLALYATMEIDSKEFMTIVEKSIEYIAKNKSKRRMNKQFEIEL